MSCRPSLDTFNRLVDFARRIGSFDGGDQGLLNLYFDKWATDDINKHLPFTYNLVAHAFYSYLPAYKQFGAQVIFYVTFTCHSGLPAHKLPLFIYLIYYINSSVI